MKVLAIRGRNLASLEGVFSIDFTVEPLLSAGIFAISGPTGAGKSTLLDAMCLALFARTPRTDQARENNIRLRDVNEDVLMQNDPRFLLRRGTTTGYAEVDFVALNGHRYRARWAVARARDKENGRLQNARITLFNLDKNEEESGSRTELQTRITDLIGLTFEQFTRSVLLAQNDFSTFLKAEQGEKASLLEKLTGTEHYSAISRLIFEKNAAARVAFDKIEQQIRGVTLLSEEEEATLRTALAASDLRLQQLEKQKAELRLLEESVKTGEQQIATRHTQQEQAAVALARATTLLVTARQEYEVCNTAQQAAEASFRQLLPDLQEARKMDVLLEQALRITNEATTRFKEAKSRLTTAEEKLQTLSRRQQQGAEEVATLHAWRERYRNKESIAEQLSTLLLHLDTASTARLAVEKATRKIAALQKTSHEQEGRVVILQKTIADKHAAFLSGEQQITSLESTLSETLLSALEQEMTASRLTREGLLIEQARFVATGDVKTLREKLTENAPCPVCGSISHPYATHEANEKLLTLTASIATITQRLQALATEVDAFDNRRKQLAKWQQQQLLLHKTVAEAENALSTLSGQQELTANQLANEQQQCREHIEAQTQALAAANRLFGNDVWQRNWQQGPDAFRESLTDFAREWREKGEQLQSLERQESSWKAERESHESFLPSLRSLSAEASVVLEKSRAELAIHQTTRTRLLDGKSANAVEQTHTRRMEELKARLQQLQTVQTVQSGLAEQLRGTADQIAKELTEANNELAHRRTSLEAWNSAWFAASPNASPDAVWTEISDCRNDQSFRLRTHTEQKQRIAGLQDELNARRSESERWAKLNELAGSADGAKFRRIAQGYTLDVLLNYANVQLRELTRRYRLERVPDTLALQVIDRDMCDEVRTVHSLSGGESFLVSLALALGLSSLSSNRMKVESLFIDEGFGSLDAETLRMAMDALESLRTQGRKIGVISHVQEMTERIPVRIQVSRAGNGRSYLEVQ